MIKTVLFLGLLLFAGRTFAQQDSIKHDYAIVTTRGRGVEKALVFMPTKLRTEEQQIESLKLKDTLDVVGVLEDKGWTVMNLVYDPTNMTFSASLRRPRRK